MSAKQKTKAGKEPAREEGEMKLANRKIVSALGLVFLAGWAWAETKKLDLSGKISVITESSKNRDFNSALNDEANTTEVWVKLGLDGTITEDVSGKLMFQLSPHMPMTARGDQARWGVRPQATQNLLDAFMLTYAYLDVKDLLAGFDARFGKQPLEAPSNLLGYAGECHRLDDTTSIDAVKLTRATGPLDLELVHAVLWDYRGGPMNLGNDYTLVADPWMAATMGRRSLQKVGVNTNAQEFLGDDAPHIPLAFNFYNFTDQATAVSTDNAHLGILNFQANVSLFEDMLYLSVEAAKNLGSLNTGVGTSSKYKGVLLATRETFELKDEGLQFNFRWFNSSGDERNPASVSEDKSFHDLTGLSFPNFLPGDIYYFGEILGTDPRLAMGTDACANAGMSSAACAFPLRADSGSFRAKGLGFNVISLNANYKLPLWDKKLKLDIFQVLAKTQKVPFGAATKKDIGQETDLWLTYTKSNNLELRLALAQFKPEANSAYLQNTVRTDKISMTRLFVAYTF